ncbi:MAG: phosphonate C-P lyase system protein PhnG [Candidatus Thiodiazotropha sp.]
MSNLSREEWVGALSAVPEQSLARLTERFPRSWKVTPKALPQSGLGMLKLRETTLGDAFYLGEFPLATCWLRVTTERGEQAEGCALVMDDRVERAERMALCDAVLAARLPGWEEVAALIEEGIELRAQQSRERKAILARTRVDFSLLDDVGDEDA